MTNLFQRYITAVAIPQVLLLLLLLLLTLFTSTSRAQVYTRVCESKGICFNCGDFRYSYYKCNSNDDCSINEFCNQYGFCCPQLNYIFLERSMPCPDGSNWMRKCQKDKDCHPFDEICAEGKCCAACRLRRRQVLDELPTTNIFGVYLPQCTENGRHYRPKQCRIGVDQCWCVNEYGRTLLTMIDGIADYENLCSSIIQMYSKDDELGSSRINANKYFNSKFIIDILDNEDDNNNQTDSQCGKNEQYVRCFNPCQATCNTPDQKPCPLSSCIGGCHCKPGYVRIGTNPKAPCTHISHCTNYIAHDQKCSDPLKQYNSCGSACPISCATINVPPNRCVEVCKPGCFCKIPYVLEDDNDPINSRSCVLPAQCQFNSMRILNQLPDNKVDPRLTNPSNLSTITLPQLQNSFHPLKSFLSCGSPCPAACNSRNSFRCEGKCISGCFCRTPYILSDSSNLNSRCVLPQNCPTNAPVRRTCSDPRKEWISCYSVYCTPSCNNLEGNCKTLTCKPGCACREPYVLKDANDPNSRCILASECFSKSQCSDKLKEYKECTSSCPMGCNNLNPKTCTPCVSGCFCKMGYIFEDSEHWQTSKCVQINQCQLLKNITSTSSTTSLTSFVFHFLKTCISRFSWTISVSNECPASISSYNDGKKCIVDEDCPRQQKCCPLSSSLNSARNERRCTCSDAHAVWNSCGSLCPEYCDQPSIPVCSAACSPGCHCAAGYVRARNDITAPCILRSQCFFLGTFEGIEARNDSFAEAATLAPKNPFEDERDIAVVNFVKGKKNIFGKLHITRTKDEKLKLWGILYALPVGKHALILHQYGDVSNSCANIGPPLRLISASKDSDSTKTLEWSDPQIVVGRSIAIHQAPIDKLNTDNDTVLTCGTVGIVS
uniref:Thyroglobulin type-1 domain-containing protein n=1 Tax=Syphacia muris TaxID=451379 RepID=A0A0N5AM31_9BILA